ncbi:MAG: germination protein YpeB [Epulopiscium sp.]|nr:germination protein YpeB [Candidatus Epulonipiscium sp.]
MANGNKKDNRLLRVKRRLSEVRMYSIVLIALLVVGGFGVYQYKQKLNYQQYLENRFQRAFYDMTAYVNTVDNLLTKASLARRANQSAPVFARLWKEAASAQENMGQIPYQHSTVDQALKFLSQVSDFSFAMSQKTMDGNDLDEEDWKQVNNIQTHAKQLSDELNQVQAEVHQGNRINWKKVQSYGADAMEDTPVLGSMAGVNQELQDIPTLIYDGPFSEHIQQMEPQFIKGKQKLTQEQAKEKVIQFIGADRIAGIEFIEETDTNIEYTIPVYRFAVQLKNQEEPTLMIDITQQGGFPLWMLQHGERPPSDQELSLEEGRKKAEAFLKRNQYPNMKPSYYEKTDNTLVVNFAPVENGVILYPDLIKVKVAMDDGEIIGFESLGYIMMHRTRKIASPKLTKEEARAFITDDFKVDKINIAVIPLESKREVLCYEFKGTYKDQKFIIYINEETGKMEKILQMIQTPNSVLTK